MDLLQRLGLGHLLHQPDRPASVPLVHIAGTKGKGSTATMVASVLTAAGYRTGLYSSPHLHRLEERFRVDGDPCSVEQMIELVDRIREPAIQLEQAEDPPTFFELTTAMALLHFDHQQCDAMVLEVGLGGRLDSTNVCAPSVTAITSIGMDHEHVLGHTIEKIAGEKAGIIKPRIPVVSGVSQPEAMAVIQQRAESQAAPLFQLGNEFDVGYQPDPDWGSSVVVESNHSPLTDRHQFHLTMEGAHQARNAAVATAIVDLLSHQGMSIGASAIQQGMASSQCIGRIERWSLDRNRLAIVDSAHNEDSIEALCRTIRQRCSGRPVVTVFGTSVDKSVEPMLNSLAEVSTHLVLTRFVGNPRYRAPEQLRSFVPESIASQTEVIDEPIPACEAALETTPPGGVLVICGSFFLAAECRHWVQNQAESE